MKKRLCFGIIIFLFIRPGIRVEATGSKFSPPLRTVVEKAISCCAESYGPLVTQVGEVLAVSADRITLSGPVSGEETIKATVATVFVNGHSGDLMALRPVAPGFYFAARLFFDQQGILRLIDAGYVGAEVEVITVDIGRRLLTVQPLDQTQTYQLTFSPLLPATSPQLAPGDICFLLLDWENRIRKIFRDE